VTDFVTDIIFIFFQYIVELSVSICIILVVLREEFFVFEEYSIDDLVERITSIQTE